MVQAALVVLLVESRESNTRTYWDQVVQHHELLLLIFQWKHHEDLGFKSAHPRMKWPYQWGLWRFCKALFNRLGKWFWKELCLQLRRSKGQPF